VGGLPSLPGLTAVISPDYIPARYSPIEWASQIWNDPDGTSAAAIQRAMLPGAPLRPRCGATFSRAPKSVQ
jgi:hypothetical protein